MQLAYCKGRFSKPHFRLRLAEISLVYWDVRYHEGLHLGLLRVVDCKGLERVRGQNSVEACPTLREAVLYFSEGAMANAHVFSRNSNQR